VVEVPYSRLNRFRKLLVRSEKRLAPVGDACVFCSVHAKTIQGVPKTNSVIAASSSYCHACAKCFETKETASINPQLAQSI